MAFITYIRFFHSIPNITITVYRWLVYVLLYTFHFYLLTAMNIRVPFSFGYCLQSNFCFLFFLTLGRLSQNLYPIFPYWKTSTFSFTEQNYIVFIVIIWYFIILWYSLSSIPCARFFRKKPTDPLWPAGLLATRTCSVLAWSEPFRKSSS